METYVLAGENRHLTRLPPVQGALRRARRARCSRSAKTPSREADTRVHRRAAARSARSHHAAHRAPRPSGRGRRVSAPHASPHPAVQRMLGPARRWVAGAAAAGLAAGLFLGFAMDRRTHLRARSTGRSSSRSDAAPGWQTAADAQDEQFLHRNRRGADRFPRARDAPRLGAIDVMTTPLEIAK